MRFASQGLSDFARDPGQADVEPSAEEVTAIPLVQIDFGVAIYRHLTNPECRQYLLRQAMRGRQQAANAVDVRHRPRPGGSGQHTGDARVDKRSIRGKAGSRQLFANSC
jgi:hypothetical protein